jgi:hypothetical protein
MCQCAQMMMWRVKDVRNVLVGSVTIVCFAKR